MRAARAALPRLARLYAATVPDPDPGEDWEALVVETAFHEAAHSIVAAHCGLPPNYISIERPTRRGELGRAKWPRLHLPSTRFELREDPSSMAKLLACGALDAMTSLAGPVMESILRSEADPVPHVRWCGEREIPPDGDVQSALRVLRVFEPNEVRRWSWLERLARRTREALLRPDIRVDVERAAERLLDLGTLRATALEEVLPAVAFEHLLEP